jgi:hypothetical protein
MRIGIQLCRPFRSHRLQRAEAAPRVCGPDGLTRVITRSSWDERESVLVEGGEAELLVFRRWEEFHREALGYRPSWGTYAFAAGNAGVLQAS